MAFIRNGTCNRCGECCGFPRASDGGQNNPWPRGWPSDIRNWSPESIQTHLPILQFADDMMSAPSGQFTLRGTAVHWIWVPGKGLCTDLPAYGDVATHDQRCPLLAAKQGDGTVPCMLVGTRYQEIYDLQCAPVPPILFETQEQVDAWFTNCPSCSYTYVAE